MRNRTLLRVIAVVLLVALVLSMGVAALAQEGGDPADPDAPAGEIIPGPNSGRAPEEAGDRGGSLQLAILALVAVAICGMAVHVVRQSSTARQARLDRAAAADQVTQVSRSSHAEARSRNPDR